MLRLHVSRFREQASQSLYAAMKQTLQKGRRAYLVVPSQFTVETEQAVFRAFESQSLMQVQIKSYPSIAREILEAGVGLKRSTLRETGRTMLLRFLVEDVGASLEAFPSAGRGEGFMTRLFHAVQEFKEYGVEPEILDEIAGSLEEGAYTATKLREVARIYRAYENRLTKGQLDTDDRLQMALRQVPELSIFEDVDFFFDDFNSMSAIELEFIRFLLQAGSAVHYSLVMDPQLAAETLQQTPGTVGTVPESVCADAEAFQLPVYFLKRLVRCAGGAGNVVFSRAEDADGAPLPIFAHAAFSAFSYRLVPKTFVKGEVRVRRFRNTDDEVDALLSELRRAVVERNRRWSDLQVIITEPSEYYDDLRRKLHRESIPFFLDEVRPIGHKPLIRFIQLSLALVRRHFMRSDVLEWLKIGYHALDSDSIASYQNFVLRRNLDRGMFLQERYFTPDAAYCDAHPDKREALETEYAVAARVNAVLLDCMRPLMSAGKKEAPPEFFARMLVDFLTRPSIAEPMAQKQAQLAADPTRREQLEEDKQIWAQLMELLDRMVLLGGTEARSFDFFCEVLVEGMQSIRVGIIPPYRDQVLVNTLLRSRANTRKEVYLLGAGDLFLPKLKKESGLLSSEEQDLLRAKGFSLPSMRQFGAAEEALSFFIALTKVGERLVISYPMLTHANEAVQESFRVQRLRQGLQLPLERIDALPMDLIGGSQTRLSIELPEGLRSNAAPRNENARQIFAAMKQSRTLQPLAELIARAGQPEKQATLSPEQAMELYGGKSRVSISQLESYAKCPYLYFIDYGLRPERIEHFALDVLELGTLLHDGIDAWTKAVADDPDAFRRMDAAESGRIAERAFTESTNKLLDAGRRTDPQNRYVLSLTKKTLTEVQGRLLQQFNAGQVQRVYHEQRFGRGEVFDALRIALPDQPQWLEGRMDRVDVLSKADRDYLQVIDYKTGKKEFQLTNVLAGVDLQLVLYLAAVTQSDGSTGGQREPFGCFYIHMGPPAVVKEGEDPAAVLEKQGLYDGVLLKNAEILQAMDVHFFAGKDKADDTAQTPAEIVASLYRLRGRKTDPLEKENVLTRQELQRLMDTGKSLAKQILQARAAGKIEPHPVRFLGQSGGTACNYCTYRAICHMESRAFHRFRKIESVNWKRWREEAEES